MPLSDRDQERWAVWEERVNAGDFRGACEALLDPPLPKLDIRSYPVCSCPPATQAQVEDWWARMADHAE